MQVTKSLTPVTGSLNCGIKIGVPIMLGMNICIKTARDFLGPCNSKARRILAGLGLAFVSILMGAILEGAIFYIVVHCFDVNSCVALFSAMLLGFPFILWLVRRLPDVPIRKSIIIQRKRMAKFQLSEIRIAHNNSSPPNPPPRCAFFTH